MTDAEIDEALDEETTFGPFFENAQDALLSAVEQLMEAGVELEDKLTDEQKLPLTRALDACFAAHYFLAGSTRTPAKACADCRSPPSTAPATLLPPCAAALHWTSDPSLAAPARPRCPASSSSRRRRR